MAIIIPDCIDQNRPEKAFYLSLQKHLSENRKEKHISDVYVAMVAKELNRYFEMDDILKDADPYFHMNNGAKQANPMFKEIRASYKDIVAAFDYMGLNISAMNLTATEAKDDLVKAFLDKYSD